MLRNFGAPAGALRRGLVLTVVLASCAALSSPNAGVSDERVVLPAAPGSIGGVGENASVEGNQGALQYSVKVEVPGGFAGLTPDVALGYSSTSGSSLLGVGWSMPSYSIERTTNKGLPEYDLDDRFAVDGSKELVRVSADATTATYRARAEGDFVRYTWMDKGSTGNTGYWKAEFPDGKVAYYGADRTGVADAAAQVRVPTTMKVFRWHLVAMEDRWGHQMKLLWNKSGSDFPLLERIEYLFDNGLPRHSVRFTWETRPDPISDGQPGFELLLTMRLKDIRIYSGTATPEQVRKYAIEYEAAGVSGNASRIRSVARFGQGDVAYPVKFTFGYSQTLGAACGSGCDKPFTANMGQLSGVDFTQGRAALVDINGDALPDVVFSDASGAHKFFYGKLDAEGRASFTAASTSSAKTGLNSPFVLGQPQVQLLDVNGDGFVDLTQAKLPALLCNDGSGDWVDSTFCAPAAPGLPLGYSPTEDSDGAQQDPKYVRFFDYDNDKRIDWLRTNPGGATTEVLVNSTAGFNAVTVGNIGAVFDEEPLQLADMNGDGLQDPVRLVASGPVVNLMYRLNLGFGQWTPWVTEVLGGLDASQVSVAELQDINGDGLADVVAVAGNEVDFLLNRGSGSFSALIVINSGDLGSGAIPARGPTTVVTYADMNGNGSDDVVWIQSNGDVTYLELFPVRPNLITRIDNGIGAVQFISYGTSLVEQGRDAAAGKPWAFRVPNPMTVVRRVDSFVTLTGSDSGGLRETLLYRYHSGFYDGVEKQFRGYQGVERELAGLETDGQEPGRALLEYDIGKAEPSFAGLKLSEAVYAISGTQAVLLTEQRDLYDKCPVAEVPQTTPPVVFACHKAQTTIRSERDPANAQTLRVEREYDGYGNLTRERNLGVVNRGTPEAPSPCEACVASGVFGRPCGATCDGDEKFTESEFIAPGTATGGAWIADKPSRERSGAIATALTSERLSFYDGVAFEGLSQGLTHGGISRIAARFGPGATDFVDLTRIRRGSDGNALESLSPNGQLSQASSHRRRYTYDGSGLLTTSVELLLDGTPGAVNALRRDMLYDPAFGLMTESSNWYPVIGGVPAATPQKTRYRYDEHGRISKILDPGATDLQPSTEYRYELADPSSRVLSLQRSSTTSGQDVVAALCFDGRGRQFQTRTRVSDTVWQVSGFTQFDSKGAPVRVYQPYTSASGACENAPPQAVASVKTTYDALRRVLAETEPDGAVRRKAYGPGTVSHFDENDTDASGAFKDTPVVEHYDGLERLFAMARTQPGRPAAVTGVEYDSNGQLRTVRDPGGNLHVQTADVLGRIVRVDDVNSGTTQLEYDAAGNQVRRTDARGKVVRSAYDALDRLVAQWDEADEAGSKVTWSYDRAFDCAECTNAGGRLAGADWKHAGSPAKDRRGYDATGKLVFSERTLAGHPLVTRFTFDLADRELSVVHPGGVVITRGYDGASRVTGLPGYVARVQYDARGQVSSLDLANGAKTTHAYDLRLRLSGMRTTTLDGSAVIDLTFTRSANGDITAIADGSQRPGRVRHGTSYTYDAWNRVTSASFERDQGDAEVLSFTFDDLDNLRSQTSSLGPESRAHLGDYVYDEVRKNAVTQAGATAYTYDAAGFVTARGPYGYSFDHLGRLAGATRDAETTGTFRFGPEMARVSKEEGDATTWYVSKDFEIRDGIAVAYASVGSHKVARIQTDALAPTLLSDLAPASDSGGSLSPVGNRTIDIADAWLAHGAAAGALSLNGGPTPSPVPALLRSAARRLLIEDVVWLHQDHLQSIVASSDATGALLAERSYYPFGEVRASTGFVDEYGFTGRARDLSTGLTHFTYRELDPVAGRWASVDPLFRDLTPGSIRALGESTAAYAYVGNDFANATDPLGLAKDTKAAKARGKSLLFKRAILVSAFASLALNLASMAMTTLGDDATKALGANLGRAGSALSATTGFLKADKDVTDQKQKNTEDDKKEQKEEASAKAKAEEDQARQAAAAQTPAANPAAAPLPAVAAQPQPKAPPQAPKMNLTPGPLWGTHEPAGGAR